MTLLCRAMLTITSFLFLLNWKQTTGKFDEEPQRFSAIILEPLKSVAEDAAIGTLVARYQAYNPYSFDHADNITYHIDEQTNTLGHFGIDLNGGVFVAKPLDRENVPKYRLLIIAKNLGGNLAQNYLRIDVLDVNDNAPFLHTQNQPFLWENDPPPKIVAEVLGRDADEPANGAPFFMEAVKGSPLWDLFEFYFCASCDEGRGAGIVTTRPQARFDREGPLGKTLQLPIRVRDSGRPSQEAIRFLPVTIGDQNDSPMLDGAKTVTVYTITGKELKGPTSLGNVFFTDQDDWDRGDKAFDWPRETPPHFDLTPDGEVELMPGCPAGEHNLSVVVSDVFRGENATGSVTVRLVELPSDAISKGGSLTLFGIKARQLITMDVLGRRLLDDLSQQLSSDLKLRDTEELHIPRLIDAGTTEDDLPFLEAFFVVLGGRDNATQLDGSVASFKLGGTSYRAEFTPAECPWEEWEADCYRSVSPQPEAWALLDANATSFVGLNLFTQHNLPLK